MSISQSITAAPSAPSRDDPDNFADKADAFVAWQEDFPDEINTWAGEANTTATAINSDKTDAESAVTDCQTEVTNCQAEVVLCAAEVVKCQTEVSNCQAEVVLCQAEVTKAEAAEANAEVTANVTVYDAGTTYNAGAIVMDSGDSYNIYTSQQGSNTGHTPYTDTSRTWWKLTMFRPREGATSVSSAVDIALTSDSDLVQIVEMTAPTKSVELPDATTMDEGIAFVFNNSGDERWRIQRNGVFEHLVMEVESDNRTLMLTDSNSASGGWMVQAAEEEWMTVYSWDKTLSGGASHYLDGVKLTSSKSMVLQGYYAIVVEFSDGVVTCGTPLYTGFTAYQSAAALDSSNVIVCYEDSGDSNHGSAVIFQVSGTTILKRTSVSFSDGVVIGDNSVARLTDTKAIVCYKGEPGSGSNNDGHACVLDVSGTTITPGSPITVSTTPDACTAQKVTALTSSTVLSMGNAHIRVLSVSGTTITVGTEVSAGYGKRRDLCTLSSTKVLAGIAGTAQIYEVSGTTVTAGAALSCSEEAAVTVDEVRVASYDDASGIICFSESVMDAAGTAYDYDIVVMRLEVSGTTITKGNVLPFRQEGTKTADLTTNIDLIEGDSSHIVLSFGDGGNLNQGAIRILEGE